MRRLTFAASGYHRDRRMLVAAGVIFALGFAVGGSVTSLRAFSRTTTVPSPAGERPATPDGEAQHWPDAQSAGARLVYPVDVIRVIDGDTFEARVQVWPGLELTTKVRLRGIDAPELHARCADELARAQAARAALQTVLAAGDVAISRVGIDKYGGRIDAAVSAKNSADVSATLLQGGFARRYDGGRRGTWC